MAPFRHTRRRRYALDCAVVSLLVTALLGACGPPETGEEPAAESREPDPAPSPGSSSPSGPAEAETFEDMWQGVGTITAPPEAVFQNVLEVDGLPEGVRDLQGGGYAWQGYTIRLRFRAPTRVVRDLVDGWDETACTELPEEMHAEAPRSRIPHPVDEGVTLATFEPPWDPPIAGSSSRCWRREGFENSMSHRADHYLLRNGESGRVYFFGFGS